jgi:5''-nucleotidase/2'',3''-cyclic phosphodiesterase and related esterases
MYTVTVYLYFSLVANEKKTVFTILSIILLSTMLFAQGEIEAMKAAERGDTVLSFIGTTDMHSNVWGYSYEDNKETNNNGMARVATFAEGIKKTNPNGTIMVDNGDTYQGTILSDDLYNKDKEAFHPISRAVNLIGFDAMVLGNHEFNFGLDLISTIESQLNFPVLGANVHKADGSEFVAPYVILDKNGVSSALNTEKLVAAKRNWESSQSIRDMLVEYITEKGTISPTCDNNWKITGVNLEASERAEIIAMVNDGKLEVPYSKSLNVNELKAEGVINNPQRV